MSRYERAGHSVFEPGSKGLVLANKLGITDPDETGLAETRALVAMQIESLEDLDTDVGFTVDYVRSLHRRWLGEIYFFAGEYSRDDVSEGGTPFCAAEFISPQTESLEREILAKHTPCRGMDREALGNSLALVHSELLRIHPFREGNGRLGRWVATLMAAQAGWPILSWWHEATDEGREAYFFSLRQAFAGNLTGLRSRFRRIVDRA